MTPEQQPEQSKESIFAALWNEVKDAPNFTIALQDVLRNGISTTFKKDEVYSHTEYKARFAEFYEYCIFEIIASGEATPRNSAMLKILEARRDLNRTWQISAYEDSAAEKRDKINREFWQGQIKDLKSFVLHDVMQRPVRSESGRILHGDLPFGNFNGQILTLRDTEHKTVIKSLFLLARDGHPFFKPFFISGAAKNNQWKDSAIFTALEKSGKIRYADRELSTLQTAMSGNFNATALQRTKQIPLLTEILSRILTV